MGEPYSETCFSCRWDFKWELGTFEEMAVDGGCEVSYSYTYDDLVENDWSPFFGVKLSIEPAAGPPECPECYASDSDDHGNYIAIFLQAQPAIDPETIVLCSEPGEEISVEFCDVGFGHYETVEWGWAPEGDTPTYETVTDSGGCYTHAFGVTAVPSVFEVTAKYYPLTVFGNQTPCDTVYGTARVEFYPHQEVTVTTDYAEGCCPLPVTFTADVTGGLVPEQYVWYVDGQEVGTSTEPTYDYEFTDCPELPECEATYEVSVLAQYDTNYQGCTAMSDPIMVTVYRPAEAVIGPETQTVGCSGALLSFYNASVCLQPDNYDCIWRWRDGFPPTYDCLSPVHHSFPTNDTEDPIEYDVRLSLIPHEDFPCDSSWAEVLVTIYPEQTVTLTADPLEDCCGQEITFTPEFDGGLTPSDCEWIVDGDVIDPGPGCAGLPHTFDCPPPGECSETHVVQITAFYDEPDCGPATTQTEYVVYAPAAADFEVIGDETDFCGGQPVQFSNTSLCLNTNLYGCIWDWGDDTPPLESCDSPVEHEFELPPGAAEPLTRTVTLTLEPVAGSACPEDSHTEDLTFWPPPVITGVDVLPEEGCDVLTVAFDPHIDGAIGDCIWDWGDGTPSLTDPNCGPVNHDYYADDGQDLTREWMLTTLAADGSPCDPASTLGSIRVWGDPIVACDADPDMVCTGAEVNLTSTITGPLDKITCQWLLDGDPIDGYDTCSDTSWVVPTGTEPGEHTLTLEVTAEDCEPVPCDAVIEVTEGVSCHTIPSTHKGCGFEDDSLYVSITTTVTGPVEECIWDWGDDSGPETGCENKTHAYAVADGTSETFTWSLTAVADPESGCDNAVCSDTVRVYGRPIPVCSVEPAHVCLPATVTLHNDSQYGDLAATSCAWYVDGDLIPECDTCEPTCTWDVPELLIAGEHTLTLELSQLTFTNCSEDATHCEWFVDLVPIQTDDCTVPFEPCLFASHDIYTITLKANAGYPGCPDDVASTTVNVKPYVTADFTHDGGIWEEDPVICARFTFTNTSSPADYLTRCVWHWGDDSDPDSAVTCAETIEHCYEGLPGDEFIVTLDVVGDSICAVSTVQDTITLPLPECIEVYVGSGFFEPGETILIPIKTDHDLVGCEIEAFEFTVAYCANLLTMQGVSIEGTMLADCPGASVTWYIPEDGIVNVAWAGTCDLQGPGVFVFLEMLVADDVECGEGCVVQITEGYLNEQQGQCPMCDDPAPGYWSRHSFDITGSVTYYSCEELDPLDPPHPRPIPGAVVYGNGCDGSHEPFDIVGPTGTFLLRGCENCDYCIHVEREPDDTTWPPGPAAITSYDAALVLQAVVEMIELDNCPINLPDCPPVPRPQEIAADVTGNGEVTAFDAAIILKCVVGHPEGIASLCTEWTFVCPEVCTDALTGDWNIDFKGILYGDVSGNWWHGIPAGAEPPMADIGTLFVPPLARTLAHDLVVPLVLTGGPQAISALVNLKYDTERMSLTNVSSGDLGGNCLLEFVDRDGEVCIALACEQPFVTEGVLLNLVFETGGHLEDGAMDALVLHDWMLDEVLSEQSGIALPLQFQAVATTETAVLALRSVRPNRDGHGATTVEYSLPSAGDVRLRVFDLRGSLIRTLVSQTQEAGIHGVDWRWRTDAGLPVSSGVYFIKLEFGDRALRSKMLVVQ
jgi:PKD repeat protein